MAEKFNFEDAMNRLSEIADKLEGGECSLEEAIKLFEEGARLSSKCYKTLDAAEQKIKQIEDEGK